MKQRIAIDKTACFVCGYGYAEQCFSSEKNFLKITVHVATGANPQCQCVQAPAQILTTADSTTPFYAIGRIRDEFW